MILVGDEVVAFMAQTMSLLPSAHATGIGFCAGGRVVAGVVYDKWSGTSVEAHVWMASNRVPPVRWVAATLDYPFNQLGAEMMVAWVKDSNKKCLWLCEKLGFVVEGHVSDFFNDGHGCTIVKLRKEDCWTLKSDRWIHKVPRNESTGVRSAVGS